MVIYPEGTTTREPDLWPMRGKTGAARLRAGHRRAGDPDREVGRRSGSSTRAPTSCGCVPRTPVTVVAGPPVDLSRWAGEPRRPRAMLEEMTDAHHAARSATCSPRSAAATPPPLWTPGRGRAGAGRRRTSVSIGRRGRGARRRLLGHRVREGARRRRARRDDLGPARGGRRGDPASSGATRTTCPALRLPERVTATTDAAEALDGAELVVLAVPSQTLRGNLADWAGAPRPRRHAGHPDEGHRARHHQADERGDRARPPGSPPDRVAVVTGPNLAAEIAAEQPAATVVAVHRHRPGRRWCSRRSPRRTSGRTPTTT